MENQNSTQQLNPLPPVPGAVAALIFGIIAVSTWWIPFAGLITGLVFGIIGMSKSGKVKKLFDASPDQYSKGSVSMAKVGKILGIIGIILSIIWFIIWLLIFVIFAGAAHYNHFM
jgi:hypothetical protein